MAISPSNVHRKDEILNTFKSEVYMWEARIAKELMANYVHGTEYLFEFDKYPGTDLENLECSIDYKVVKRLMQEFEFNAWYCSNKMERRYVGIKTNSGGTDTCIVLKTIGIVFSSTPFGSEPMRRDDPKYVTEEIK